MAAACGDTAAFGFATKINFGIAERAGSVFEMAVYGDNVVVEL